MCASRAGRERQLYDLATRWYEDPYDRTRPLWMFVIVDGLEGGRGALFSKMHHSITDGIGALRLSEKYLDLEADAEQPAPVDLDAVLATSIAAEETAERSADGVSPADNLRRSLGHVARRQIGRARRAVGEVATWTGDPLLARDFAEEQFDQIRTVLDQLDGDTESRPGSPLWTDRSRRRRLETITLSVSELKAAGKTLDASINDLFVTGLAMGAIDYHTAHGVTPDGLNASFVVSTRSDDAIGGNSFTPTMLPLAGSYRKPKAFLKDVKKRMAARREAVAGDGALAGFAGVANLLPTSVVTQVARATAGKLDIATSNLRGAPFPTYIAGSLVERNITLGPVSGTAMNITAMSNADVFEIGLVIDPAAVADPAQLRAHVASAYADLLAAAGVLIDTGLRPTLQPGLVSISCRPFRLAVSSRRLLHCGGYGRRRHHRRHPADRSARPDAHCCTRRRAHSVGAIPRRWCSRSISASSKPDGRGRRARRVYLGPARPPNLAARPRTSQP